MRIRNSTRIRAADTARTTIRKTNQTAAELEQYLIIFRLCRLRLAADHAISQINRRILSHDDQHPNSKP